MVVDRSFVAANERELARMRALVSGLTDQELGAMVNEYWSVAGVLGHIAFWDGRALYFARKLRREPSTAAEQEPEDVDWINDSSRPLIHAIAPRVLADLAVSIADETDGLVASLPDDLLAALDENSPLNPVRAGHRGEHLDEIEAAIRPRT
jgi:DinB family protein